MSAILSFLQPLGPRAAAVALALACAPSLGAVDQTNAEKTKTPVKAAVVGGVDWNSFLIGDIQVTYSDGTTDRWTTKRNCGIPRVAPDGTVGWTVFQPERPATAASYNVRTNGTLVMCRQGHVLCRVDTGWASAEEWDFVDGGRRFVVKVRALHGPAMVQLRDTTSGKLIEAVKAYAEILPAWAQPYRE